MKEISKVDLGSVKIHKKVLAQIIHSAVSEMDGVSLLSKGLSGQIVGLFGIQEYPGITVNVDRNNQVTVEVKVSIRYGLNIPDIARQIQDTVRAAIEKTVDIDLKDVNVNIHGIERGS